MTFKYCVLNAGILYKLSQFPMQTATEQYNNTPPPTIDNKTVFENSDFIILS